MTVTVAPEVRAAQRRIVSTINASGRLNADGLALWREVNCGEWKATAADISRDLDLLQVPHTIVTAFRFPLGTSYSKAMREGEEVRILRALRVQQPRSTRRPPSAPVICYQGPLTM
ncbi:hypothetical protein [Streptomyces sp. NPDC052015]|uniref:hypothetical protein n=1 Tax=Streptomyces sp. NPDC052015 TaxID=3154755 RepID=UPI003415657D